MSATETTVPTTTIRADRLTSAHVLAWTSIPDDVREPITQSIIKIKSVGWAASLPTASPFLRDDVSHIVVISEYGIPMIAQPSDMVRVVCEHDACTHYAVEGGGFENIVCDYCGTITETVPVFGDDEPDSDPMPRGYATDQHA